MSAHIPDPRCPRCGAPLAMRWTAYGYVRACGCPPDGIAIPACRAVDGRVFVGLTHGDALRAAIDDGAEVPDETCEGWVLTTGDYVARPPRRAEGRGDA